VTLSLILSLFALASVTLGLLGWWAWQLCKQGEQAWGRWQTFVQSCLIEENAASIQPPTLDNRASSIIQWFERRLTKLLLPLQQRLKQQQREADRLRYALHTAPFGLMAIAGNGTIQWCNASAADHWGIDSIRDVGKNIHFLVRLPAFQAFLVKNQKASISQIFHPQQARITTILAHRIARDDGESYIVSQDISESVRLETTRRDFVANVSHEIKTPLAVMAGALENLQELSLSSQERQDSYRQIQRQVWRLATLTDDLLTLSQLEADPAPPHHRVSMTLILQELREMAENLSRGAHTVGTQSTPSAPDIQGSERELMSAFSNLISNAIRYSPAGGKITMHWGWQNEGDARSEQNAVFTLTDQGKGIAKEHLSRLTERFYRVDRGRSADSGGTGLGLAIVKHIMLRHGGRLEVKSVEGKGSSFSLIFPPSRLLPPAPRH
jgi:two-component system phosphate regulon sensor histidine kinase PhoR